jgi:hypothetical protein
MFVKKRKIVTVHNPRTGLTSIETALCYPVNPVKFESRVGFWHKHFDLDRVLNVWGKQLNSNWLILGCVRCPLQLIASQWMQFVLKKKNLAIPKDLKTFRRYIDSLEPGDILYPISAEVDAHMPEYSKQPTSAGLSQVRFYQSNTQCSADFCLIPFERIMQYAVERVGQRMDFPRYLLPHKYEHWYTPKQIQRVREHLAPMDYELHQHQLKYCQELDPALFTQDII